MVISHKPGTVFNSPETQQWIVHGQPTCPISVSLFETEFLTHFLSYKHQSRNLMHKFHTSAHNSFWTVTDSPKISKKFHNSVPCFGTDPTAHSRPFSIQIHDLKQHFNTKFQHKQPTNSGQSRMVGKIPKNF